MAKNNAWILNSGASIILFILAPFLSFIGSIMRARNERNLWILFFFYILFGLCFTLNQDSGFDSLRYVREFESIRGESLKDFYLANIIKDGSLSDMYYPVIAWTANKIGGSNYHIMFLLFSFVFAVFTIQSLKIYYVNSKTSLGWMYTLTIFILISNNFIFNIIGMRFWTAAWILLYGVLSLYVLHRKIGFLWVMITPLVHSTFILPLSLIIISRFLGQFEKVWITVLIVSVPFSFLSLSLIPTLSNYVPDIYLSKFDFYTNPEYIQERSSGTGFTFLENFLRTCMMVLEAYVLYRFYKLYKNDSSWALRPLFNFTVIFVAFANFFSAIPSGVRYIIVSLPLVIYLVWIKADTPSFRKYMVLFLATMSFSILDMLINKTILVLPVDFYYSNLVSLVVTYI